MPARKTWLIVLGGLAGSVVGLAVLIAILLATAPGHRALRSFGLRALAGAIDGEVRVGSIGGALWREMELRDVELKMRDGGPAIRAARIRVTYALTDLLRRRFRFGSVRLERPEIHLEQEADGHWNLERLFKATRRDSLRAPTQRPLVVFHDVQITGGTLVIVPLPSVGEPVRRREVSDIQAEVARLRISHPDSTALVADLHRLAGHLDEPETVLRNVDGLLELNGDTLRFDVDHVTLPGTRAALNGQMHFGGERLALNVAINARPITFADVRGMLPQLPEEGGGEIALRLQLNADGSAWADVRQMALRSGRSAVSGKAVVAVPVRGDPTLRGMSLDLRPLDLAILDPFVDSLPVRGLVRGRVTGGGSLRNLTVDARLAWNDEAIPVADPNLVDGRGRLVISERTGLAFRGFELRHADVDVRTIRQFAPSVNLDGRLRARGTVEGPWRLALFHGVVDHYGSGGLASTVHGDVRLALGDTTGIDADVEIDSLSLDLLRRTYPQIPIAGTLRGRAALHGPLTALAVDLALVGDPGRLTAQGTISALEDETTVRLEGTFDTLNLNGIGPSAPPSVLAGRWALDLRVPADSTRPTLGTIRIDVTGSTVAGVGLDEGVVQVALEPDRLEVRSAQVGLAGGTFEAAGFIGRGNAPAGTLSFTLRVDTVGYLEPLLRWFVVKAGDSATVKLDGKVVLNGRIDGTTDAWALTGALALDGLQVEDNVARGIAIRGGVEHHSAMRLALSGTADSVRMGALSYAPVDLEMTGGLDSMSLRVKAGFFQTSSLQAVVTTWADSTRRTVQVDSLELKLPVHTWRLTRAATIRIDGGALSADTVELRSDAGEGYIRAAGAVPRQGSVNFVLVADSVSLSDLYALAQRDTSQTGGAVNAEARISGSADAPVMAFRAALAEGRVGDYHLPLVQVLADYRDRKLSVKGGLWRDSMRLVAINGSLPLDLALHRVANRQLEGPISIVAQADTLDMEVLNVLFPSVLTDMSGRMALDVRAGGTWSKPIFTGFVDVEHGTVRIPAINARYDQMDLRLVFGEDSVLRVVRGQIRSGGTLDVTGQARFETLTKPVLDVRLRANGFHAFNIPSFGEITATGDLTIRGPILHDTLSGNLTVDEGTLQFTNLVSKRIVSLDDPEFREMVDSNLARAELAPSAIPIFLDSLRIERLTLTMGPDVWLRSSEASIQLAGSIRVERRFDDAIARYRIDGTLNAVRGNYKLTLGMTNSAFALTRDFRVTRGAVRFFGTPDFNPEMDVTAEHVARTVQGDPLTVRVNITGTLQYPELRLESDARPPLSETEIASYLLFGQPASPELGLQGALGQGVVLVGSALGGVGQALVSELGLPLNYLTVTPGANAPNQGSALSTARIEAGAQINDRTFLTLNAGLCEVITAKRVGVSLEYRLSPAWSLSAAFEPVIQTCGTAAALAALKSPYQFGFDVAWRPSR